MTQNSMPQQVFFTEKVAEKVDNNNDMLKVSYKKTDEPKQAEKPAVKQPRVSGFAMAFKV